MNDVWDTVKDVGLARRGFDQEWPPPAIFALRCYEDGEPFQDLAIDQEDVRASFVAISDLAGYVVGTLGVDPDKAHQCRFAAIVAQQLENQARGLKLALQERSERHENESEETDG